jgi:hypothetical protein
MLEDVPSDVCELHCIRYVMHNGIVCPLWAVQKICDSLAGAEVTQGLFGSVLRRVTSAAGGRTKTGIPLCHTRARTSRATVVAAAFCYALCPKNPGFVLSETHLVQEAKALVLQVNQTRHHALTLSTSVYDKVQQVKYSCAG